MLKASKNLWFEKIFAVYNRNLLKRRFDSIAISNFDSIKASAPMIFYANHSSWWDGLLIFEISRQIKADSYVMMEEKHLKRLFLFRRLGGFSIVRESARQSFESLNYAINLLEENPRRSIWIFPQGKIMPNDARPLKFYRGMAKIVERTEKCTIVPVALRYEFLGEFKPRIFVKVGETEEFASKLKAHSKLLTVRYEKELTNLLDELTRDVTLGNTQQYQKIL